MNQLQVIVHDNRRVLTTSQLAECYGADVKVISNNYTRNAERYKEGKHFIRLTGEDLKSFKAIHQIDESLKFASILYLWTEKGAWHHAKSLGTDEAWDAYEMLVDEYYNVKDLIPQLNNLSPQLQTLIHIEMEQNKIKEQLNEVKSEVQGIREVVAINTRNWRKDTNDILNKIAQQRGGFDAYQQVRQESYELLEARGKCKLSIRLTNMKRRMLENGQSKSKVDKVSKLDVIDRDTRLLEIYTAIVKEMAIANKIDVDELGA